MGVSSYFGWYVLGTPISLAPELCWVELRASGGIPRTGARSGMKRSPRTSTNLDAICAECRVH
jgi:hypothetical protein